MSMPSQRSREDATTLRRECGAWLREKREAAGLSQRELAMRVGIEYYTFISQIEAGRGRVPNERYEAYAEAIGVPAREFTMTMLWYGDPIVYDLLFREPEAATPVPEPREASITDLEKRLSRLERKLKRD